MARWEPFSKRQIRNLLKAAVPILSTNVALVMFDASALDWLTPIVGLTVALITFDMASRWIDGSSLWLCCSQNARDRITFLSAFGFTTFACGALAKLGASDAVVGISLLGSVTIVSLLAYWRLSSEAQRCVSQFFGSKAQK